MSRQILHLLCELCVAVILIVPSGCGSSGGETQSPSGQTLTFPPVNPEGGPPAGNPEGAALIPAGAGLEDVSNPDHVIGDGTADSCGAEALIDAVAQGGTIVFDCGPDPITLTLPRPAKVFNDADPDIVIDGGGLVSLSGGGRTRILYMNTCDADQVWSTPHCQNQDHPRLTVQNITFANGNSTAEIAYDGGGAIWVRGGRFKAVNCRFFNSLLSFNRAIGYGANPAETGTPGGGSGGAIYNDGNTMTLTVLGTRIEYNEVNEHGSAIFFVSNDHTGNIVIDDSVIVNNIGGFWYPAHDGISMHGDTRSR